MTASPAPSFDAWLAEARQSENAAKIGMYLTHVGVVRESARARVRLGDTSAAPVTGMVFSYNADKVDTAIRAAYELPGIYCVKVWLAEGTLRVGDDIMRVLIGGDIRPHVLEALTTLVGTIKNECVQEQELHS